MELKKRVEELKPGMKISRQIRAAHGVLVSEGTELSQRHIRRLKDWQVEYVRVYHEPERKIA